MCNYSLPKQNTKKGSKKGKNALKNNGGICIKIEYSEKIFIRICLYAETQIMARNMQGQEWGHWGGKKYRIFQISETSMGVVVVVL